jgi:hypothetical protein
MSAGDEVRKAYAKFLEPARLRENLLLGALYLATFEVLKTVIVNNIVGFFSRGEYEDGEPAKTARYWASLAKYGSRDVYRASCLWHQARYALSSDEVETLLAIREHRMWSPMNCPGCCSNQASKLMCACS